MFGKFYAAMRVAYVSSIINTRHSLKPRLNLTYHHNVENDIFSDLNNTQFGIFVHWGVYESGKTTAVQNVGLRLQNEEGKTVIYTHGYDFPWERQMRRPWLRQIIGIPKDCDTDPISTFLNKPTTIIIDHFDLMMQDKNDRADDTLSSLRELANESAHSQKFNVLLVLNSWERAIQIRDSISGCKIIGSPNRWTEEELKDLFETLPETTRRKFNSESDLKDKLFRLATLAGTPGYLTYEAETLSLCPYHAALHDKEWCMGARALAGKSEPGDIGRYPDKNGVYHRD
jgi:hypothetical protein